MRTFSRNIWPPSTILTPTPCRISAGACTRAPIGRPWRCTTAKLPSAWTRAPSAGDFLFWFGPNERGGRQPEHCLSHRYSDAQLYGRPRRRRNGSAWTGARAVTDPKHGSSRGRAVVPVSRRGDVSAAGIRRGAQFARARGLLDRRFRQRFCRSGHFRRRQYSGGRSKTARNAHMRGSNDGRSPTAASFSPTMARTNNIFSLKVPGMLN